MITAYIEALEVLNYQIAQLRQQKEELEAHIAAEINHPENCQKSYKLGQYKVTVKTGRNYKIDIARFLELELPEEISPIKQVTKYEVSVSKVRQLEAQHGALFSEFLSWTPSKLAVTIGANA